MTELKKCCVSEYQNRINNKSNDNDSDKEIKLHAAHAELEITNSFKKLWDEIETADDPEFQQILKEAKEYELKFATNKEESKL
jgi:guanylate kinase